jgi:hypothetical protein
MGYNFKEFDSKESLARSSDVRRLTLGCLKQILGFFNEFFDIVAGTLKLFFVRVEGVSEERRVLQTFERLGGRRDLEVDGPDGRDSGLPVDSP